MIIEGVIITPLDQIVDERGKVMHMLRCDNKIYSSFGEVYFSIVNPGSIKAWKLHKKMSLNCCVPSGKVKFVIHDTRNESKTTGETNEFILCPEDYFLITVPPLVWTGFKGICEKPSILTNCANIPHDPLECERKDIDSNFIPYSWNS